MDHSGGDDERTSGDPLAGPDAAVAPGVDPDSLARLCLALGDDALVYSYRLQQWISRMPELELETSLANVALDLLTQAEALLGRAGAVLDVPPDDLAYGRDAAAMRSVWLVEHADDDLGELVVRLAVFATWRLAVFEHLTNSRDHALASIAIDGIKQLAYHRDWSAQCIARLGADPALQLQDAVDLVWIDVDELFVDGHGDVQLEREEFELGMDAVLAPAGLTRPVPAEPTTGTALGRVGVHTFDIDDVLAVIHAAGTDASG